MQTLGRPKLGHYVAGRLIDGNGAATVPVYDPASGNITKSVALGDASTVAAAVRAARDAFAGWSATPPLRRAAVLFGFRELVLAHAERLARIITAEHGKTLSDARGEVQRGLEVVEFACGIPHLLKGEFSENVGRAVDSYSLRQALGVCAGISPFNFPAMVPMWMFPVALACGNTFIMKPSEKDPSLTLELAQLLAQAQLPAGVFNVVNGAKAAVDALLAHPGIAAISFVGSTPVARHVYERGTAGGKRVQALGGAKNHLVIMPDADLEQTTDALMGAAFGSAGERCMAVSIAVPVGDGVADALVAHLRQRIASLRVGAGDADGVEMGPLISDEHRRRVHGYVDLAEREGAHIAVDGRNGANPKDGGFFFGATVLDCVTPDMRVYREEIFGPVLGVVRAADFEAALRVVNGHECGNGAAIFTRDGDAARVFTQRVQAGMVGVNVAIPVPMAFHSFGGWKASLFGDHHVHGPEGVRFYTRLKTVTCRWPAGARGTTDYAMPTMR